MWLPCLLVAVTVAVLLRHRKLKTMRKQTQAPLAGFDTGVRSPWRTPGRRRWTTPHRTF